MGIGILAGKQVTPTPGLAIYENGGSTNVPEPLAHSKLNFRCEVIYGLRRTFSTPIGASLSRDRQRRSLGGISHSVSSFDLYRSFTNGPAMERDNTDPPGRPDAGGLPETMRRSLPVVARFSRSSSGFS